MFKKNLYQFQEEGAAFLVRQQQALLADEVGLGKTPQALKALQVLFDAEEIKNVLIVCPNTLKYQWGHEIEKFTELSCIIINGNSEERKRLWTADCQLKIVNYEVFLRDNIQQYWDAIVLDEVQRIKNNFAKTTFALKRLKAKYKFALSATPLENQPQDLFSIIDFIKPMFLGTYSIFEHYHVIKELRSAYNRKFWEVTGYKNLGMLKTKVAPLMLRRTKREVDLQIPELIIEDKIVGLSIEQRQIYDRLEKSAQQEFERTGQFNIAYVTLMRLVCNSSELIELSDSALKMTLRKDIIKGESQKIDELIALVKDIIAQNGDKIVIFTQWRKCLDIINNKLREDGIISVEVSGIISSEMREENKKRFEEDKNIRVMLCTDAAKYGLNLQCANYLINIDLPWNPKTIEQRIGRVHRIGQQNKVHVYNLITQGTIEDRVNEILASKSKLFDDVIGKPEVDVMSNREFMKKALGVK